MNRDLKAETKVGDFYDGAGWETDASGVSTDAQLWEDLRPCAAEYVHACRLKLLDFLPKSGDLFLDAASGPIQYPEYLSYSAGFRKRVCVDISQKALEQARKKLGDRGDYVCVSILELPFPDKHFDAIVSLHTIYHIDQAQQEAAVRQLIRVAKPEAPIVIVYANPDKLLARLKRLVSRKNPNGAGEQAMPLYYHAHPLSWWNRFADSCSVQISPWRSLTHKDAKFLIPDNALGKSLHRLVLGMERRLPGLMTKLGAYPVVVLKKRA